MRIRMLSSARSRILGVASVAAVGALVLAGCAPNPTLQAVPLPPNTQSKSLAINNLGQVVGYYYSTSGGGGDHAFLYNSKTNVSAGIPPIPVSTQFPDGGTMTDAYGINDSGVIVGLSTSEPPVVAYDSANGSWQAMPGCSSPGTITDGGLVACGTGVYDLSTNTFQSIFSTTDCQVVGVNDSGKAAAICGLATGTYTALVIDLKTGVQMPIGTDLGTSAVCVTSISDSDVVVGNTTCGGAVGRPFAYDVSKSTPVRVSLGVYDSLPVLTAVVSDSGMVAMPVLVAATSQEPAHERLGTYDLATNTAGAYDDSPSFVLLGAVNDSRQVVGFYGTLPIPPAGEPPTAFYGQLPAAG